MRLRTSTATDLELEGNPLEVGPIWAGDLVALRRDSTGPLVLGKVVRCSSGDADEVRIHVKRLSVGARPVSPRNAGVRFDTPGGAILVLDEQAGGRRDACLVSERAFDERLPIGMVRRGTAYALQLQHLRERGRGWALARFEIGAAA